MSLTLSNEVQPFDVDEYKSRIERLRIVMKKNQMDAVVVTSESNVEYLSGFETQFAWNTPARPWYFVVPASEEPFGVIPEIGESNWLATSWCKNIETWPSPRPEDEGVELLLGKLSNLKISFKKVGFEIGPESRLGMPVSDLLRIKSTVNFEVVDCTAPIAKIRLIKSPAEIQRIQRICHIAGKVFDELPNFVSVGDSEKDICRKFASKMLMLGADKVPYTAIGSGNGGYDSIIMGPTDRRVENGDVLILDTGARYGGYFCDFDRNFSFGEPSDEIKRVFDALWHATEAGINAARPGNTASDIYRAQAAVLSQRGFNVGNIGRFGHGLGKQLTEYPSIAPGDDTILQEGMVITIEPSASFGNGRIMAHEENLVVTSGPPCLLSKRADPEIVVI